MSRLQLVVLTVALGLLAIGVACDGGNGESTVTDTAVVEATATQPSSSEAPCPVDDAAFCEFAEDFDRALRDGDVQTILASTLFASLTCTGAEIEGPCAEFSEAIDLSGYIISFDHSDYSRFETEDAYLSLLSEIMSAADALVSDEFGDGTWKLVAIVDGPDMKVLVTTSIGPDPLYEQQDHERRVFLFWARRDDDIWQSTLMLTTLVDEPWLTGTSQDGTPRPDWLPWGEE